uniref:Uncharacterized protein n=1 Tax=Anguilla anguilla TaxID=7936 RepID=A0A0E9XJS5_ANGAN
MFAHHARTTNKRTLSLTFDFLLYTKCQIWNISH